MDVAFAGGLLPDKIDAETSPHPPDIRPKCRCQIRPKNEWTLSNQDKIAQNLLSVVGNNRTGFQMLARHFFLYCHETVILYSLHHHVRC